MAHSFSYPASYIKEYNDRLEGAFKMASVTSNLDARPGTFKPSEVDNKTVYIRSTTIDGLSSYSRTSGYVAGDIAVAWNSHSFSQDRGRNFQIDAVDEVELGLELMRVGSEVQRLHVAPEVDAYRFEAISSACGVDVNADLTYDTVIAAIDEGIKTLYDAEVPEEGLVLYVSSTVHKLMKESGVFDYIRDVGSGNTNVSRNIEMYEGMVVKKVPAARFYTDFDFETSTGDGAFTAASGSYEINFAIVAERYILGIKKHEVPKVVKAENIYQYDSNFYCFRLLHDCFVPNDKVSAVYIHCVADAEA